MHYAMLIKPHANARYRLSLQKLALAELACMLEALGVSQAHPRVERIAQEPFLTFECETMENDAWRVLSRHSAICLAALIREDGALTPIERQLENGWPDDLPQVLKYKGKTNADFTSMLIHCAWAASSFRGAPLCVLDPMCGKATTLFCALLEGHDAVGIDIDSHALNEADVYFARSLRLHRLKHRREQLSLTLGGGGSVRAVDFRASPTPGGMRDGSARSLRLIHGDSARLGEMVRPGSCHIAVCDLPYGVQHAPMDRRGVSSLPALLAGVLPGCKSALKPGGALAVSFNLHTLARRDVLHALEDSGFRPVLEPPYDDFSHWVEQAVERDVVVARRG